MNPQPSFVDEHLAVQRILPWYVAGMLHADEEANVAQHLASCAACRADLALEQRLLAGVAAADPLPEGVDPEAALARLMPRLDGVVQEVAPQPGIASAAVPAAALARLMQQPDAAAQDPTSAAARDGVAGNRPVAQRRGAGDAAWRVLWRRVAGAFDGGGWRNWALAAQGAVIVGLGALLMPAWQDADPAYRALGNGTAAAPDVVVMFQPDARADHMQQVLQASGARIVDGPTVTGAYLLDVDAARRAQLLAALRADPAVRLAEPLGAGAAP